MIALLALALGGGLGPTEPAVDQEGQVLASYSFDDDIPTGPDTFAIWKGGRGRVRASSTFHLSGYRSLELKDAKGDGTFPELQGYFPLRRTGRLHFHFAFLTTDPREELNVALAGPERFHVKKDGIAFWLSVREGRLLHHSDSIPKRLVPVEAFAWYAVDVAYDVAQGVYDLRVRREGQAEPVVSLRAVANASSQPGSAVDKFSFVGDALGDASSVTYYVHDVVIGTDERVHQLPFVAPGRRKHFVDAFAAYQRRLEEKPRCLPAVGPEDFGPGGREGDHHAADAWAEGCAALEGGRVAEAVAAFEGVANADPEGGLGALSAAIALAGRAKFDDADEHLARVSARWREDPRYAAAAAYVGVKRGDLDGALATLRDPAGRVLDREANPFFSLLGRGALDPQALATLARGEPSLLRDLLEETLLAEQYYYVQLWKGRHGGARDYALAMSDRLRRAGGFGALWTERAGDAAFFASDLGEARAHYEQARAAGGWAAWIDLKLADVAFLEGDLATERRLRERYYGALTE